MPSEHKCAHAHTYTKWGQKYINIIKGKYNYHLLLHVIILEWQLFTSSEWANHAHNRTRKEVIATVGRTHEPFSFCFLPEKGHLEEI